MNNILLMSNNFDITTCRVIDYLVELESKFACLNNINLESDMLDIEINNENTKILLNQKEISQANNWFRRYFNLDIGQSFKSPKEVNIKSFVTNELESLQVGLLSLLSTNSYSLGSTNQIFDQLNVNKLYVLELAKKFGLNIPSSLVSNNQKKIYEFRSRHREVIIKPLSQPLLFRRNEQIFKCLTKKIELKEISQLSFQFPSFFQEYIDKKYEIRSFFFEDKFYNAAIISQNNSKTKVDYRNYDEINPNRIIPCNLPKSIEIKLLKLLKQLDIATASIDLIKAINDKYYFLEVNPVGQFGDMSDLCNYNLHFKIAFHLKYHTKIN